MSSEILVSPLLSECLIGTWQLLSRVDRAQSGDVRIDPTLGEHPVALLHYDRAGHFSAQFMKRDRETEADTDTNTDTTTGVDGTVDQTPATPAANNSRARGGYDAYFGTYTIDDAASTVTQTLIGALSPENVGHVLTRHMVVLDDALTIRLDTTSATGDSIVRTLIWQRVG
jgi:hypothetical protein